MPQEDKLHPAVVRALIKDGWQITREQVHFVIGKRNFWIDIEAERHEASGKKDIIFLEVKGFQESSINQLYLAVGQYVTYRAILKLEANPPNLYLAVSKVAYSGILSERIGRLVRDDIGIKLVVVDESQQEIDLWIP